MQTGALEHVKPRKPNIAALLGAVCIGAGLIYVGRKKTALICIALALIIVGVELYYHVLWTLWFLAVLWYWQVWYGYDKAEEFNEDLLIAVELSK